MSCNGCRVLRKGCSDSCLLRPCIQWIDTAEAQGHATVFVAKFFGRAGLMSFISNVPPSQRPSLFQSLLFEACGRTINPVTGAVGLLGTGNWQLCQAAVDTVLRGGTLRPLPELMIIGSEDNKVEMPSFSTAKRQCKPSPKIEVELKCDLDLCLTPRSPGFEREEKRLRRSSTPSEGSVMTSGESSAGNFGEPKLLSLFV